MLVDGRKEETDFHRRDFPFYFYRVKQFPDSFILPDFMQDLPQPGQPRETRTALSSFDLYERKGVSNEDYLGHSCHTANE